MPKAMPQPKSRFRKRYILLLIVVLLIGFIFLAVYDPFNRPYIADLTRVAERGDAEASWCLHLYYLGNEDSKAEYWLQKAAYSGYPRAQYLWSVKSLHNASQDKRQEAVNLLFKSAQRGYPPAEAELGNLFFFGSIIRRDENQSEYWLRQAAQKGIDFTMLTLAQSLADRKKDFTSLVEAYSWSIIGYNRSDSSNLSEDQKRLPETILEKAKKLGFVDEAIKQASEKKIQQLESMIASYHYTYEPEDFSSDQCKARVK
jgi:TPR repeat protein